MAFRFHIVTPPLNWSRRKTNMMIHQIRTALAQEGAPNATIDIEHLTKPAKGEVRKYFHLTCEQCLVEWHNEIINPCPQCGKRSHVTKLQPDRVALPQRQDPQTTPKGSTSTKAARTNARAKKTSDSAA